MTWIFSWFRVCYGDCVLVWLYLCVVIGSSRYTDERAVYHRIALSPPSPPGVCVWWYLHSSGWFNGNKCDRD